MPQHGSPTDEQPSGSSRGGRVGPPTSGTAGSMYDFVRRYLVDHGGSRSRQELLWALQSDEAMRERLARSKGFTALLHNMRHSGDVVLDGNQILASDRSFQRLGVSRRARRGDAGPTR